MEIESGCKAATRDRILNATLEIIGNEGFQNVTIKKIAVLASVNIAAVNYHFGSKDNVINEAMKILTQKLMKSFEILDMKEIEPAERLRKFLQDYSDTTVEYPDIFRNYISHSLNDSNIKFDYVEFLKDEGMGKIRCTLEEAGIKEDGDIMYMRIFQMISALEFPVLLGEHMKDFHGINYDYKTVRNKYIDLLLKSLLLSGGHEAVFA